MKKLLILISVILMLATAPLPYSGVAEADKPAETKLKTLKFSAEMIITDTLESGESWEDERGHTQIRGLVLEEEVEAASKFLDGAVLVVSINADLDGSGTGFDWGSDPPLIFTVDNGQGFQGTWEGRFVGTFVEDEPFDFEAFCFGTGDFEGLIAVMIGTREVPGGSATIDVYITDMAESKMHIKFSTWHPPVGREVKTVFIPMLEKLKAKSNGRITYTMYAGGALGTGPEHYDIARKGLSDMGYFTATWTPGRFPLSDVLSLAATVDGKDVGVDIGNAMYDRILKREFPGVKMIELNGCIQAYLWTTKPVKTLEDCKGLRIRSPGGHQTNYINAIGAEPVFMPLGDVYLAMETGTIDGLVTCPPLFLEFKLYEVAKYGALCTFGCVTEGIIMNKKSWNKTPDDLKPLVMELCSNPFRTSGGLTRDVYKVMMKEIAGKGVNLYTLPEKEAVRWYARFQDETRKWVKGLEAKGLPAKETVIMYNEECEKRSVKCVAFPPEWK